MKRKRIGGCRNGSNRDLDRNLGKPEIRELFVRRYRLIYKIEAANRIYIVRGIHGARDFSELWPNE